MCMLGKRMESYGVPQERLRVKFSYLGQEFHHTFTAATSSLFKNYQDLCDILEVTCPYDEALCKERLAAEIIAHRLDNCYTSHLFEHLYWVPSIWINDLVANLQFLEHNWV